MARRSIALQSKVPFLPEVHIEREADCLLTEYGEEFEAIIEPPVPIEDMIELHLQLVFELIDLSELFKVGDVHGAIWINEGKIAVDTGLDPEANPRKLGRYRYTLAHETGHWRLHRGHYLKNDQQRALFDSDGAPAYICRSSDPKQRRVWNARVAPLDSALYEEVSRP